jgi:hypothetical protein
MESSSWLQKLHNALFFIPIFTDDLEMKPSLITNMMQRKDISKYIYKYFIEKDEKENVVKGIVKCEQKLDTESLFL